MSARTLSPELAERLDRLYRQHAAYVLRVARTMTRDADAADDVAAETWAQVARYMHTLHTEAHVTTWLFTITRHTAARHYRPMRAAEVPTDWADVRRSYRLPPEPSAEDVALADVEPPPPAVVRRALAHLPARERRAVELRADGLPFWAMAERCGTSRWTVTAAYRRGVETLRRDLAPAGGGR